MKIINSTIATSLDEIVLFPFEDYALPLQRGVDLQLKGYQGGGGTTRIVLAPGDEGCPDSEHVAYYGSVKRVGDEFWMWYLGQASVDVDMEQAWFQRVCLAKSRDGYHWERPNLGLVEYNGNKNNNLVDMGDEIGHIAACVVFFEPDDPVPERRFKMAFADRRYRSQLAVAFSADGLTWQESPNNPVGPWLEMAGGTRIDDAYFLSGQGGMHIKDAARQFATHTSYDFEHWTLASTLGMQRTNGPIQANAQAGKFSKNGSEQIHLGAGLWNRGNVVIGFYGMWNGHTSNDRRMVNMDLGLAVSHDALHYREPIPNFPIVSAAEDSWKLLPERPELSKFPALMQGQGFENIGNETLFWYFQWPEQKSDGVRVAVWPRDRLGCFQAYAHGPLTTGEQGTGLAAGGSTTPHIISAPIDLKGQPVRVSLNADPPNQYCGVSVEVLDEHFHPVEGYTHTDCDPIREGGFRQQVTWNSNGIPAMANRIRIRIDFTGIRFEDALLYAVYLETGE